MLDGRLVYELILASSDQGEDGPIEEFEGSYFQCITGDYKPFLTQINYYLNKAIEHTNDNQQKAMLELYVSSFKTGSIENHVNASKIWVRSKPVVDA